MIFTEGHTTRSWHTYNLTPECKHSSQAQTSPQWDFLPQVYSQPLIPGDSPALSKGSQAPQQVEKNCHVFMLHSGSWLEQLSIIDTPYLGALIQLRMLLCPSQFIFQRINYFNNVCINDFFFLHSLTMWAWFLSDSYLAALLVQWKALGRSLIYDIYLPNDDPTSIFFPHSVL